MTISPFLTSTTQFDRAYDLIARSGIASDLDSLYEARSAGGGRPPAGIHYTLLAVLVATMLRIMAMRPPTYTGILTMIATFDSEQLDAVGMGGQDTRPLWDDNKVEYGRFAGWLTRRLDPIDPGFDLPARRVTNKEHLAAIRRRSASERKRAAAATEELRRLINALVAASIRDPDPSGFRGDLVADESIYDLAGPSFGLGTGLDKYRAAPACGRYYSRDRNTGAISYPDTPQAIRKAGYGIGLTAITRVGPPDALHTAAPVIVGVDIHEPTSGSPDALQIALDAMRANGLGGHRSTRSRWPNFTIDMGYNPKQGFAELMLNYQYSPVARYPAHWKLKWACADPTTSGDDPPAPPGPIQVAGAFYCPAVASVIDGFNLEKTRDLLGTKDFKLHDDRLRRFLPFLMGTNSRPFSGRIATGRPRLGIPDETAVKQELVCPAVMGRVRCPLKPDSMADVPIGVPTAEPNWKAHERRCCQRASVTVTLTKRQLEMAQWNLVPGSWEHTLYFESCRSLTERRFSLLKSPHITGIEHLKYGPRREPMIKIILAMAVAATNLQIQDSFDRTTLRTESRDIRLRQLTKDLGREPTRTPPRT